MNSESTTKHRVAIVNAMLVTPFRMAYEECVLIENGKIAQIGSRDKLELSDDTQVIDVDGMMVTPGFIDLHIHGAMGRSFNEADRSAFDTISEFFISHGTTSLLATLYLDEREQFLKTISELSRYCKEDIGSTVLGIHLEGPFINKKMKGALNENYIVKPSVEEWDVLQDAGKGYIKMMTIAPELEGSAEVMQRAAQDGVVLAIAHSEARYEDIEIAIDNGLSQVTHIFNSMHPVHHRTPGVLSGALLKRELKVHLIADGIHVHPAVIQLLYKLKGPEGIILITDAISATSMEDGVFDMGGKKITVREGTAHLDDNTLAGSTITLEKAVKVMVEKVGVPVTEAVRMVSLNPARVLGLDRRKGILAVGKDADMVVLDNDYEVQMTIIGGQVRNSKV